MAKEEKMVGPERQLEKIIDRARILRGEDELDVSVTYGSKRIDLNFFDDDGLVSFTLDDSASVHQHELPDLEAVLLDYFEVDDLTDFTIEIDGEEGAGEERVVVPHDGIERLQSSSGGLRPEERREIVFKLTRLADGKVFEVTSEAYLSEDSKDRTKLNSAGLSEEEDVAVSRLGTIIQRRFEITEDDLRSIEIASVRTTNPPKSEVGVIKPKDAETEKPDPKPVPSFLNMLPVLSGKRVWVTLPDSYEFVLSQYGGADEALENGDYISMPVNENDLANLQGSLGVSGVEIFINSVRHTIGDGEMWLGDAKPKKRAGTLPGSLSRRGVPQGAGKESGPTAGGVPVVRKKRFVLKKPDRFRQTENN